MNPFEDLTAHEALMSELSNAVSECNRLIEAAKSLYNSIENHNNDATSHPDLRTSVEEVVNSSVDNLDERIAQHDQSSVAHATLKAELTALIDDVSKTTQLIENMLNDHNISETAHGDMRATLNALNIKLEGIDLTGVVEEITGLRDIIESEIYTQIEKLQSTDARHDNEIITNRTNIATITSTLDQVEQDIQSVANGNFIRQEDLDKLRNNQYAAYIDHVLGIPNYLSAGPSLLDFTHTLPVYLPKKGIIEFTLDGAVGSASQNPITYSITLGKGGLDISPKTDISKLDPITLVTNGTNESGDLIYFIVRATDGTTSKYVEKTLAACIAKPMNIAQLQLTGLPAYVEPGESYNVIIRNLVDDGTGRYSYSFDPKESNLIFTPSEKCKVGDEITITVPSGLERGEELKFDVIAHDTYCDDQNKEFILNVNEIPGAEGFTHTLPAYGIPGKVYTVKFSGVSSPAGIPANYTVLNLNDEIVFSKYENILANENIKITISPDASRGTEYNFTVKATTSDGVSVEIPCGIQINTLPDESNIVTTLPVESNGGVTLDFTITGGTDSENSKNITYDIDVTGSNFVVNKTTGIKDNESVRVVVPKVSQDTMMSMKIYVVDSQNERSANPKTITIQVKTIYVADTPSITYPAADAIVDVDFTMKFTAYSQHVDM